MRLAMLAANRLFNTPVMIHPLKAEVIMSALAQRLGVISLDNFMPRQHMIEDAEMLGFFDEGEVVTPDSDYENLGGAAVIPLHGTLVNKLGSLRPYSGMTGYDGTRQNYLMALRDDTVKGIVFDCESPGGEVAGCFDLADLIYENRKVKPHIAICSEYAYSAAFCLAAATGNIVLPRTGGVGSVGIIVVAADFSRAIEDAGIKVTLVTYGERKADGRPEIPLSKEARKRIQEDVDYVGGMFTSSVARYLNLSVESVINTSAGCFMGAKALDVGFAQKVAAPDEALRDFIKSL